MSCTDDDEFGSTANDDVPPSAWSDITSFWPLVSLLPTGGFRPSMFAEARPRSVGPLGAWASWVVPLRGTPRSRDGAPASVALGWALGATEAQAQTSVP